MLDVATPADASRIIAVICADEVVCALVVVSGHQTVITVNARLRRNSPAWGQAVDHAGRHLGLGQHVAVCEADCPV